MNRQTLDPARVRALLEDSARPLKAKEIARELGVSTSDYRKLKTLLREMTATGDIYKVKRGRYAPPERINVLVGRLATRSRRNATVVTDGGETLFVAAAGVGNALDGDRVAVRVIDPKAKPLPEAEVIRVMEHAHTEIVGTLSIDGRVASVRPENPKIPRDVLIPPDGLADAKDGDLVTVRIESFGDARTMMVGAVSEVLGQRGDPGVDVLIVMKEFDLPLRFPDAVEAAAERLPASPRPRDLADRMDLTDRVAITIDPVDAKDFDDALSIRSLGGGRVEVGVHIADVSHYVTPGSVLDREAHARATSVYLVDRVVPMLPEALSNRLCSLIPNEDRLAFSALFRMTSDGEVSSVRFTPSIIHSRRRFAYQEVQALLDGGPPAPGDAEFVEPLQRLAALSDRLIARRTARGSLDFDLPASRVILDEHGMPIDIQKVERLMAHRLVESFMLLANEAVAKRLATLEMPGLHRVHQGPDALAVSELRAALARFGVTLRLTKDKSVTPRALQRALAEVADRPEAEVVNTLVLRSMKRALYDATPHGHFGLAARHYTHFTSPIRRYPDLIVHRVLRAALTHGEPPVERELDMQMIAEHCSTRERNAEDAERQSVELKKVQFMAERIGDVFEGRIVSVTVFGFFVELDAYHVNGLVHVNRLGDDYYAFTEDTLALVGEHTARQFRIGDRVTVEVSRADLARRQIDFDLVEVLTPRRGGGRASRKRPPGIGGDGDAAPHPRGSEGRPRDGVAHRRSRGRTKATRRRRRS